MDNIVKQSIEARRMAFEKTYEINDEVIRKQINDLFNRIEAFGENCVDAMDFETKFSSSTLNQEYTNLFTQIATKCKLIEKKDLDDSMCKSDQDYLVDEMKTDAKLLVEDLTMPARRKAREELDSKLRDTPLGKIETAQNTLNLFGRLFKK